MEEFVTLRSPTATTHTSPLHAYSLSQQLFVPERISSNRECTPSASECTPSERQINIGFSPFPALPLSHILVGPKCFSGVVYSPQICLYTHLICSEFFVCIPYHWSIRCRNGIPSLYIYFTLTETKGFNYYSRLQYKFCNMNWNVCNFDVGLHFTIPFLFLFRI